MDGPGPVFQYFPDLSDDQRNQFRELGTLYRQWNEQINVISRKDISNLYLNHVLHSLGIAKVISFIPGSSIVDVGTGGGFPGIPLAILFPEVRFHLVDSIKKKIKVVKDIVDGIGLENVRTSSVRAESLKEDYDFVVCRTVMRLQPFYLLVRHLISSKNRNQLDNGILYLKGGSLSAELRELVVDCQVFDLKNFLSENFFEEKRLVLIPCPSGMD